VMSEALHGAALVSEQDRVGQMAEELRPQQHIRSLARMYLACVAGAMCSTMACVNHCQHSNNDHVSKCDQIGPLTLE